MEGAARPGGCAAHHLVEAGCTARCMLSAESLSGANAAHRYVLGPAVAAGTNGSRWRQQHGYVMRAMTNVYSYGGDRGKSCDLSRL